MDCYCDYDPPEFVRSTDRKARKQYFCEECHGVIRPGEVYEYTSGKWDGYLYTFHICKRCADIRTWTRNNIPCLCWSYGNLIEDCRDAITYACDRAPDETKGVRFGFGRLLVGLRKHNAASKAEALT